MGTIRKLIILVTLWIGISSCESVDDLSIQQSGVELHLFDLINQHREGQDLSPLLNDLILYEQTKRYLSVLAKDEDTALFLHKSKDEEIFQPYKTAIQTNMPVHVYSMSGVTGIIHDLNPGGAMFNQLMRDSKYKAQIESQNFTHLGVAAVEDRYGVYYFALIFVKGQVSN